MAVAGLHNVFVIDSSYLRESQPEAIARQGDDGRARPSSILQMWRELEDEHAVAHPRRRIGAGELQHRNDGLSSDNSRMDLFDGHGSEHSSTSEDVSMSENDCGRWSPGPSTSDNGQDDSSDLGEIERERVRQTFRDWMNCAARECSTSNISRRNNSSRAEWLGETEQERVRVIREWVQMNSQQRGSCLHHREDNGTEIVGQIEQVLDGSVVNRNEAGIENTRRSIRRLCGRQALLDMLKKAEMERRQELQVLSEHRAVSQFAHRNRIQALLRGRFLWNSRVIEDERPTSTAASELGLLRQTHTVSGLREGFFSRLDQSVSQVSINTSDTSSNTDINGVAREQGQVSNSQEEVDEAHAENESNIDESDNHVLSDGRNDTTGSIVEDRGLQEPISGSDDGTREVQDNGIRSRQQLLSSEFAERGGGAGDEVNENRDVSTHENEAEEHTLQLSTSVVFSERGGLNGDQNSSPITSNVVDELESIENINQHTSATQVEQQQSQILGSEDAGLFRDFLGSNEWRENAQDNIDEQHHETNADEWLEHNDREEASELWHEDGGLPEAIESWLEEPSQQEAAPVGRVDTFYFPDYDNVYSMEMRELLSRRSVSTLLRSGFRESLDRLIRSYVERQSHAPLEWELDGTSPTPALEEQELEQQSGGQNESREDSVQTPPPALPSQSIPPVQQLWDQEAQHFSWPQREHNQRFEIDWDIINDMRLDMARLQQRMNNMQRMLEACMDMQLELQRSIRQEVSAALNRSAGSEDICENSFLEDRSKWDSVRKGICCICCDSNIDSLLYRCGHMCTCSKCANELVQKGEKCPMCRAPVIEVIRAYSIL